GMKPVNFATAVLATAMAVGAPAAAQEQYPSRMITVVVPLTAGTTIDILARLFAERLSKRFGQQVIVANRPGAGGLIAAQPVAHGGGGGGGWAPATATPSCSPIPVMPSWER